ncbi:MAG: tetratricopeptide repeat protein [Planctomycetota bacterium]
MRAVRKTRPVSSVAGGIATIGGVAGAALLAVALFREQFVWAISAAALGLIGWWCIARDGRMSAVAQRVRLLGGLLLCGAVVSGFVAAVRWSDADARQGQQQTTVILELTEEVRALKAELRARRGSADAQPPDPSTGDAADRAVDRIADDARNAIVGARELIESGEVEAVPGYLVRRREEIAQRQASELIEIDREIAATAFLVGQTDVAEAALGRILAARPGDLDAVNKLGHVYRRKGELSLAEAQYRELLERDPSPSVRAAALGNLGLIYETRGDLDRAEEAHEKSLALNEELGRKEGMAANYGNLGLIYLTRGDLDRAKEAHERALALNKELGRKEGMAADYGNLGLIYRTRGDLDRAEEAHERALALNEELGRKEGIAAAYGNLGLIYRTRGDLDRAEEAHEKSLAIEKELGRKEGMAADYGNLGLIYRTRGDLDRAEEAHERALALNKELGRKEGMALQYGNLGLIYRTRGDLDRAEEAWEKSLDLFTQVGARPQIELVGAWLDDLRRERAQRQR